MTNKLNDDYRAGKSLYHKAGSPIYTSTQAGIADLEHDLENIQNAINQIKKKLVWLSYDSKFHTTAIEEEVTN